MTDLQRPSIEALDEILGKQFKVLDDGFVRLVDYMGNDGSIVQAARVSYGKGTKKVSEDRGLIRYLMRHQHCYHPSMQVLTSTGWKTWGELGEFETFMVPNPNTRELVPETLPIKRFDSSGEMMVFRNNRMSYSVTSEHKMWFRGKYQKQFQKVKACEMSKWGHFEGLSGYSIRKTQQSQELYYKARLAGFFLGDGYKCSANRIVFGLKKKRKIEFLEETLRYLGIEFQIIERKGLKKFWVDCQETISQFGIDCSQHAAYKSFNCDLQNTDIVDGLFDGLVNSDGSYRGDRPQINFCSKSKRLALGFETLCALKGIDAHFVSKDLTEKDGLFRVSAYIGSRTSLESRAQYHSTENYSGKVYCTTTSTGLLFVRGSDDSFAFISSNSTPFEMCELKLHVRVPMDCWRQWIRHRTASVNEYSTRYSEAIDSCQKTNMFEWRLQSKKNKQGSSDFLVSDRGADLTYEEEKFHEQARRLYKQRLEEGVAREQARKDLPLSTYTEAYWKINLKNLLHFLGLRMDSHAQKEIRDYATVIGEEIVAKWVPVTWEAFNEYHPMRGAQTFTSLELQLIKALNEDGVEAALKVAEIFGWLKQSKKTGKLKRNRERSECEEKLKQLGLEAPWKGQ